MSQWDKLIRKITNLSVDLRFSELKKILENCGYTMHTPKGGSSHAIFRRKGCSPITIPRHDPIKKVYVEMVKRVVESEDGNENN